MNTWIHGQQKKPHKAPGAKAKRRRQEGALERLESTLGGIKKRAADAKERAGSDRWTEERQQRVEAEIDRLKAQGVALKKESS